MHLFVVKVNKKQQIVIEKIARAIGIKWYFGSYHYPSSLLDNIVLDVDIGNRYHFDTYGNNIDNINLTPQGSPKRILIRDFIKILMRIKKYGTHENTTRICHDIGQN